MLLFAVSFLAYWGTSIATRVRPMRTPVIMPKYGSPKCGIEMSRMSFQLKMAWVLECHTCDTRCKAINVTEHDAVGCK